VSHHVVTEVAVMSQTHAPPPPEREALSKSTTLIMPPSIWTVSVIPTGKDLLLSSRLPEQRSLAAGNARATQLLHPSRAVRRPLPIDCLLDWCTAAPAALGSSRQLSSGAIAAAAANGQNHMVVDERLLAVKQLPVVVPSSCCGQAAASISQRRRHALLAGMDGCCWVKRRTKRTRTTTCSW
jgi:hypothetical protein